MPPRNLSDGEGRRAGLTFRVIDLDREDRFLDPVEPVLLRAVDSLTKEVKRATDLIALCKERLHRTEEELKKISE